jgi:acetolactate synthase-1/2/3 large subunit
MAPLVKWMGAARRVRELPEKLAEAFHVAQEGVPGPVFLECPVDLLYDEEVVKSWYAARSKPGRKASLGERLQGAYLGWHTGHLFAGSDRLQVTAPHPHRPALPPGGDVRRAAEGLGEAQRPVLVVGSQALSEAAEAAELAHAVEHLGVPVYLTGMARGLLGASHPLQLRHHRKAALREADLVILAGVPMDFRLDYGQSISRKAFLVAANRNFDELYKNRRPQLAVHADPGRFLRLLSQAVPRAADRWEGWRDQLRDRDASREEEMARMAEQATEAVNPLALCAEIERSLDADSVLVADGGDFVGTASYIVRPRGPLRWLDPGAFGTLGVGAGFALGAKLARPDAEVGVLWGDGAFGYSLPEYDTFVRHALPVIGVVGNDACWMQIAREQVEILHDDVGCALRRSDYHLAAEGLGARGLLVRNFAEVPAALAAAKESARQGRPVLLNAHLGATDFRKGSLSM